MKTFSTSGTGSQQTLSEIESDKIPIYDSLTDAESDLANLTVGQIIATKDEGNETSTPVDVVQDGNMHAVTSNAVAKEILDVMHDAGIYTPDPPYTGISYIIPVNKVQSISQISGVSVEGKTIHISFRVYRYAQSFTVQLSYGTTDAVIQQMTGDGRNGFIEITQDTTDYTVDGAWKIFDRSIAIPQGNSVFGIGVQLAPVAIGGLVVS